MRTGKKLLFILLLTVLAALWGPGLSTAEASCTTRQSSKGLTVALVNQEVHPDGTLTYQWRVTNTSKKAVSYVLFELPSGVEAVEPTHGSIYAGGADQYLVENPTHHPFYGLRFEAQGDGLAAGASEMFTFTLPAGASLVSPMYVEVKRGSTRKKFKFYTRCADVELEKTASRASIVRGDTVTFKLVLQNVGSRYVKNLIVADPLPAGMHLVEATADKGTYTSHQNWEVDRLEAGEVIYLRLVVRVDTSGVVVNRAELVAADGKDIDSEPNNKEVSEDDYAEARVQVSDTGGPPSGQVCYLVADSGGGDGGDDLFVTWYYEQGIAIPVGRGTGTYFIEAIAFQPGTNKLFAADAGQLGLIDRSTGRFQPFDEPVGGGNGFFGWQEFADIDGLSFDPHNPDVLYGTVRRSGPDLLIRIDPETGRFVPGAFGGNDYQVIQPVAGLEDIDDLAISSYDGTVYAIANNDGVGDHFIVLDRETGETRDIGPMPVQDIEGLGFDTHGVLYGIQGGNHRKIYRIHPETGEATEVFTLPVGSDYESFACLTQGMNVISGRVFYDENRNGVADEGEPGEGNVPVRLYRDANNNGEVDAEDPLLEEIRVPSSGEYAFHVASEGSFIVRVSEVDFPDGAQFTTPLRYVVRFTGMGQEDRNNDFGYYTEESAVVIDLRLEKDVDVSSLREGGTATFTIIVSNEGTHKATGIWVRDDLPDGLQIVEWTSSQGSFDPQTVRWKVGTLERDARAVLSLVVQATKAGTFVNRAEVDAADQPDRDSTPGNGVEGEDDQDKAQITVSTVPPELTQCYATEVVEYAPGHRADGTPLESRKAQPWKALGRPENNLEDVAVALGFGGSITLRMGGILYDGDGNDLFVVERSEGSSCSALPERAEVLVSRDGHTFTSIGEVCQDGALSLEHVPSGVQYVRIHDRSDPSAFPRSADGYDVDGLIGAYCQVTDTHLVDLAVLKETNRTFVSVGDRVTFEIHVHNDGPGVATGIQLHDPLPYGITYVSHTLSQGTFDPQTQIWSIPRIEVHGTVHLQLVTEVSTLLEGFRGEVENEVEIVAMEQRDIDSTPGNWIREEDDNSFVTIQVNMPPSAGVADLELTKTVTPDRPEVQQDVTFTLQLTNRGPDEATGIVVRDVLPVGLSFIRAEPSVGEFDESQGYWSLDRLENGASATLTLVARVTVLDTLTNQAQVLLVDQDDPDSTPGNDVPSEDDQDAATIYAQGPPGGPIFRRPDCAATGTIYDMAYDAARDVLYAASAAGRIHVSTDGGENWPATFSHPDFPVQTLLVTEHGVYAGTAGGGVWVSTDQENTWSAIGPSGAEVASLTYDPASGRLYAGMKGKVQVWDGASWSDVGQSTSRFGGKLVRAVFYEGGTLWAADEERGVYRYDGNAWIDASQGLPDTRVNVFTLFEGRLLSGTWHDGVYAWNGQAWEPFGTGLGRHNVRDLYTDGKQMVAGTQRDGLYAYREGKWRQVINLPAFTVLAAAINRAGAFFAAVPADGIYRYESGTWYKSSHFLINAVIQDLAMNPETGELYAATYGYGVLYSDDGGQCWIRSNRGLTNYWVFAIERASDGTLYIGTWADGLGGVWRSTDNARSWEYLDLGRRQIVSLAIDPSNERRIYAGANLNGQGSLYRSDNGGLTWITIQSFTRPVWAVRVDPSDARRMFIGTLGEGVFVSEDGGGNWQQMGTQFAGLTYPPHVYDIAVGSPGTVFEGLILVATNHGVYRYEALTNRWVPWGVMLIEEDVRSLLLTDGLLLAGTWGKGVFRFDRNTSDWEDLGLGDLPVVAFSKVPSTDEVLIGTAGQGVYLLSDQSITVQNERETLPEKLTLENYPNPFAGTTRIRFTLPEATSVSLVLYDVLGREVRRLKDDFLEAGEHLLVLRGDALSSGVYFLRMQAGREVRVQKIMVVH